MTPFISICIPAYKRVDYLKRLLESIIIQNYKNFEVIITDDTPGDEVMQFCTTYTARLPLHYFKNKESLGTPENWNEAIRKASGQWIKIMHDDDWFSDNESLQQYADAITSHADISFFFSAYNNIYEQESNRSDEIHLSKFNEKRLNRAPLYLFRSNFIGNPSCTLFRKEERLIFDSQFKWVVDFEYYIRYLSANENRFVYIDEALVNLSVNTSQVTKSAFRIGNVEIPENHLLLIKLGFNILKNIFVYDHFWRLYRNIEIKSPSQIIEYGYNEQLHPVLISMVKWQRLFPSKVLKIGPISKAVMLIHYCTHINSIK